MADLGKAYVQIMPSAQGISGSISKVLEPEASSAGKNAGKSLMTSITDSMGSLGKNLTKYVTLPAAGAITALGGVVGALGFGRLVGMDTARAKLQGLGFEGKQLETIMNNARNAVTGTTFATADGAYVAAGALAAGVKEGAELERYIRLVGDAAIGAGAPIEEMAQIFDRVQDSGKLTRNELEMINYRLPGFSKAMQKHVGAESRDAFLEMVTAGKVSSDEMLDVMEDFAGGMSEAYAGTFSGLKDNILANIGIIGEALLEGLFEDGKEGMENFLEYLRDPEGLREWAIETGETIREVFQQVVEVVKDAINWWAELDDGTKKLITTFGGIAVIAGPVLLIITKIITVAATLAKGFALLKTAAGVVGAAIGAISAPVAIAVGAIAGAIAIGVALYKNWDTVMEWAKKLGNMISNVFGNIRNAISNAWNSIRNTTSNVWNGIRNTVSNLVNSIRNTISNIFNGLRSIVSGAFNNVRNAVSNGMRNAFNAVTGFIGNFKDAGRRIVTSIADGIKGAIGSVTGAIGNVASKIRGFLPFSPPDEGPLRDIMDVAWGETIASGIEDGERDVAKAMDKVLDFDVTRKARFTADGQGSLASGSGGIYEFHIEMPLDGREFIKRTIRLTAEELERFKRRNRGE